MLNLIINLTLKKCFQMLQYLDLFLSAGLVLVDDLLFLRRDHLDGLHEAVGHDGDADEEVE